VLVAIRVDFSDLPFLMLTSLYTHKKIRTKEKLHRINQMKTLEYILSVQHDDDDDDDDSKNNTNSSLNERRVE